MLKWTHRDLNPGPLPCKGSALPVWATGPKMILQSEMYKLSYTRKILEMSIYKNVRRWSSRRFPYGYLVTTSPSLKNLDSNITKKITSSSKPFLGGVTGGVCKEQGRIHRAIMIRDYYAFQLHENELQSSIRTTNKFRGLPPPFGVGTHCLIHCSPRVAQRIRGIRTYRRPLLPPIYHRRSP